MKALERINQRLGAETLPLLSFMVVVLVGFALATPLFLTGRNLSSMAFQMPALGLLTLAMMVPILSGGLNLAIIYQANLAGLALAWTLLQFGGPDAGVGAFGGAVGQTESTPTLEFIDVETVAEVEAALAEASAANMPVMVDLTAEWCISCKEMEHYTFTDATVQKRLRDAVLLQADVTANDDLDQDLLKHFGIFGPPTIVFFDLRGNERTNYRVVGFMPAAQFASHVAAAFGDVAASEQPAQ